EDGIRDATVTGVQTCALPISLFYAGSRHPALSRESQCRWFSLQPVTLLWLSGSTVPDGLLLWQHGVHADCPDLGSSFVLRPHARSEERRVGKGCRSCWLPWYI